MRVKLKFDLGNLHLFYDNKPPELIEVVEDPTTQDEAEPETEESRFAINATGDCAPRYDLGPAIFGYTPYRQFEVDDSDT